MTVGIDIIEIGRVAKSAQKESFVKGVFTERETEFYRDTGSRAETLAGIFAAKEAVAKAAGTGFRGFRPADIEILHTDAGQPYAVLHNGAAKLLEGRKLSISISHNTTTAVAVCIAINPSYLKCD